MAERVERFRSAYTGQRLGPTLSDNQLRWFNYRQAFRRQKYISAQERRYGCSFRDPFSDKRVVEFCLGIPAEPFVYQGQTRSLARRLLEGKAPDLIRLRRDRNSYPADMADRRSLLGAAVIEELATIRHDDAVWQYADRGAVAEQVSSLGPTLTRPGAWRDKAPRTLVRVALLARFLRWVERKHPSLDRTSTCLTFPQKQNRIIVRPHQPR